MVTPTDEYVKTYRAKCRRCDGYGFVGYESCKSCLGRGELTYYENTKEYFLYPDKYQTEKKETKGMNYSRTVMLFNEAIRGILVSYEVDANGVGRQPFTLFKALDPDLKVGDYVTYPSGTRHNITVGRVEEIIDTADVDFDDSKEVKWIISRVPLNEYDSIVADEQKWISEMKKAENRKKKQDIKNNMVEMYKDDSNSLETLAIAGRKPAPTCMVIAAEKEEAA